MPLSRPGLDLPLGFAHRGARAECRDNTIDSFTRALQLGARSLESDAWVTADGEVVLDHDGLVREGWRRKPMAGMAFATLPAHVPRLADLYSQCGTAFDLSLDVKDPAAAEGVIAVADGVGALDRLWLCSDDLGRLPSWRHRWEKVALVASTRRLLLTPGVVTELSEGGVDAVNLRDQEWDAGLVGQVHRAGLLAFGWDAQTPRQLHRLLGLGIDGVYSDHVDRMVRALAEHQAGARSGSEPVDARQRPDQDESPSHQELLGDGSDGPGVG